MDLVVASDLHLDHVTRGVSRFDDLTKSLKEVECKVVKERAAFAFLGDLCDPDKNLSVARAQHAAISMALLLAQSGLDSHWLAGNHDVIEDGSGATTLTPIRAVAEDEQMGVHVHVYERPEIGWFNDDWKFLALPFTALSHDYDPTEWVAKMLNDPTPFIVMSHLSVDGIVAGEETKEMPRGRNVLLPLGMLKARAGRTIILQGHFHERHITPESLRGKDVIIPGSLGRLNFGEEKNDPGFLHLEIS